jgi:tetratricopeptide (TPR) repeat protein
MKKVTYVSKGGLFNLFSLLALTTSVAFGQANEIKQARYQTETDQNAKAIQTLEKAISTYPTVASLYYYLGVAQIDEGQKDAADKSFSKGISTDEKEALNFVGRGYIAILNNIKDKAKVEFDKALALTKSKNAAVLQGIGDAYLRGKQPNEALSALSKANSLQGGDPVTLVLLGDTYLQQNNGGLAVSSYEKAAAADPKSALPHYKIGLVYLRSKNYSAAEEALNKAVQIDPNYTLAHKELGELYYSLKKADKAVQSYEKYLALTSKPESGKTRYAFFLFMAGDFAKANTVFKDLAAKPDATLTTLKFYAISLYQAKDYTQSKTMFDQYFAKAKPEETEAADYKYYGLLLVELKQDSLAFDALMKSFEMDPKQADLLEQAAKLAYNGKMYPQAILAYKKLIASKPKASTTDLFQLGRAYYFSKQFEQADTAFAKVTESAPTRTEGPLWQARSKASIDSTSEAGLAKPYYEKFVEMAVADPTKNKKDLIEAYQYMGYYHYVKSNEGKIQSEIALSKSFWEKVLALDPSDEKALAAIKALTAPQQPKTPKGKR